MFYIILKWNIYRKKTEVFILKKVILVILSMLIIFSGSACSIKKTEEKKIKDLDYTVVEDDDLPKELAGIIEEKKDEVFTMTFDNKESLYMVAGYGAQPSGGYCVTVDELYETKNSICFKPGLRGPDKTQDVEDVITYPYIVVKIEYMDKTVLFK